jgi:hypothetical protein
VQKAEAELLTVAKSIQFFADELKTSLAFLFARSLKLASALPSRVLGCRDPAAVASGARGRRRGDVEPGRTPRQLASAAGSLEVAIASALRTWYFHPPATWQCGEPSKCLFQRASDVFCRRNAVLALVCIDKVRLGRLAGRTDHEARLSSQAYARSE